MQLIVYVQYLCTYSSTELQGCVRCTFSQYFIYLESTKVQSSCTTTFVLSYLRTNKYGSRNARTYCTCTVYTYCTFVLRKKPAKKRTCTCTGTRDKKQKKTRTKGYARAPSRETYLLPRMRSRRISLCTIAFQASTPNFLRRGFCVHALCRERGTRTSRIAISGKIYDFFVTRSIVCMPSNCHRAKFRARVLTRTLLYVFFCHEYTYVYVYSTRTFFFVGFFQVFFELRTCTVLVVQGYLIKSIITTTLLEGINLGLL